MLSRCFLDFSVGIGAFVIGPNQVSPFFHFYLDIHTILNPGLINNMGHMRILGTKSSSVIPSKRKFEKLKSDIKSAKTD